jgi:uncharacterized protein (DUF1330 family)
MPTYIVGDIHITDPDAYQAHVPRALATIARFGGRVIAGGGRVDLLEGDPMPERIFIIEFPNADAARRWYRSDDYKDAAKARLSASHGRVFLIEGSEISTAIRVAGVDPRKIAPVPQATFSHFRSPGRDKRQRRPDISDSTDNILVDRATRERENAE